jgi:hypothetical protein
MSRLVRVGETRNSYKMLVRYPLQRPKNRWKDNVKMYLQEIGREIVEWITLLSSSGGFL